MSTEPEQTQEPTKVPEEGDKNDNPDPAKGDGLVQALMRIGDQPPKVLPTVFLDDLVPFPGPIVPVLLENEDRRDAILNAKSHQGFFLLLNKIKSTAEKVEKTLDDAKKSSPVTKTLENDEQALKDASATGLAEQNTTTREENHDDDILQLEQFAGAGTVARLLKNFDLPDSRPAALVHLVKRARPIEILRHKPFAVFRVDYPVEVVSSEKDTAAILGQVRSHLQKFFEAHPNASDEVKMASMAIESAGALADFVGQHLSRDFHERLQFLEEMDVTERLKKALDVVLRELDLLTIGNRITQDIREKVEKHQRDFFLREQLKAIRVELGEERDPATLAMAELKEKLNKAGLSKAARERADEELRRLQLIPTESPEHNVIRSYVEWIASLPWSQRSEDNNDIIHARKVLDEDHYGLEEIKDRIIEFLAVKQLKPDRKGSMLCFAGPPGVGKTSLGKSIARALSRQFYRFSVGGMRDEAEIKGHRRTYIGAMPGRVLQGLRQVKTNNPVFVLDELDKIGKDWRGDPSSALLEVLDPEQNSNFLDHYLDINFDLSHIMFIATVNVKTDIPDALRDRLEIIDLSGYIPEEKLQIAEKFLFGKQRQEHGLQSKDLRVTTTAFQRVIREYTHEAGVRELNRQIERLCRKRATQVVQGQKAPVRVRPEDLPTFLGPPKIHDERIQKQLPPGLAVGLAWTAVGGEVLMIESTALAGKGNLKLTGQLGEVMSESANLAISYVRSRAAPLGIDENIFKQKDFHLHFPAGAVKKDGPSAGVTITTALISLLLNLRVKPYLAMTGEITLRGEVMPVGGIREKVVAARRAGIKIVILPKKNQADVQEIPDYVQKSIEFIYAETYDDILQVAFMEKLTQLPQKNAAKKLHKKKRPSLRRVGTGK